jgi:arylsulfatase A-like enzyme
MRSCVHFVVVGSLACAAWAVPARSAPDRPAAPGGRERPNLVFILADDLAQGDLGCYGQKLIRTPSLDRMAAEGTRYTQAYSGTSVCAPSRTSLMTGLHIGHAPSRGNKKPAGTTEGQWPIPAGVPTVAEILKGAGYATGCMGKWGMGYFDTTGSPLKKGFDRFFGYNCQSKAHSYFPPYLDDNDRRVTLDGKTYAQDRIQREVLDWVRKQAKGPFFLFYPVTLPHGNYEIDDLGEYAGRGGWTEQQKTYAAMVTRLDRDVGALLALLKELGIDGRTLVMFAGDNGSSFDPKSDIGRFFDQSMGGRLRGFKRGMYEGGLRQAAIARWPGVVPAGRVSDEPWAFWDFLPTAAELAGAKVPAACRTDGLSLVPFLKGGPAPKRECFYWELHERRFIQAVRFGDWKAVRNSPGGPIELYDLAKDGAESTDLAAEHPDLVAKAEALLKSSRTDDPNWPVQAAPAAGGKKRRP